MVSIFSVAICMEFQICVAPNSVISSCWYVLLTLFLCYSNRRHMWCGSAESNQLLNRRPEAISASTSTLRAMSPAYQLC
jgi:hypothetical protein